MSVLEKFKTWANGAPVKGQIHSPDKTEIEAGHYVLQQTMNGSTYWGEVKEVDHDEGVMLVDAEIKYGFGGGPWRKSTTKEVVKPEWASIESAKAVISEPGERIKPLAKNHETMSSLDRKERVSFYAKRQRSRSLEA